MVDFLEVNEYISKFNQDDQAILTFLRSLFLKNLQKGFLETIEYNMLSYVIPLDIYPNTYNNLPLSLISLARQKNYFSLHLMFLYMNKNLEENFISEFKKSGKKLNMGKACLRFNKLDDLPLELIAKTVSQISVVDFIEKYEESIKKRKR